MADEIRVCISSIMDMGGLGRDKWITLPEDEETLTKIVDGLKYNEDSTVIVVDYEGPFEFGQYEDIIQSNRVLSKIIEEGIDLEYVATVLDFNCSTLIDFFDIYDKQQ